MDNGATLSPFDKRAADNLADEVAVLIRTKVIDSRSPAADALLDYRDPPSTDRTDRIVRLEILLAAYKKAKEENDERFIGERDEARAEVERLREIIKKRCRCCADRIYPDPEPTI